MWLAGDATQPESDSNANRFIGQTQAKRRHWRRIQTISGVWSSDGLKPVCVSRRQPAYRILSVDVCRRSVPQACPMLVDVSDSID